MNDIRGLVRSAWSESLEHDDFTDADPFFQVAGGNSLTALRVMATLSSHFKARLPVRMIFQNKTVDALSAAVEHQLENGPPLALPKEQLR